VEISLGHAVLLKVLRANDRSCPGTARCSVEDGKPVPPFYSVRYGADKRLSSSGNIGTGLIGWTWNILAGRNHGAQRTQLAVNSYSPNMGELPELSVCPVFDGNRGDFFQFV
jgi:hypothetical protein